MAEANISIRDLSDDETVSENAKKNQTGEALLVQQKKSVKTWIVDSGATHHMCNQRDAFVSTEEVRSEKTILLGNSTKSKISVEGSVELDLKVTNQKTVRGKLKRVLYTPEMSRNLFSITECVKQGKDVFFDSKKLECRILYQGEVVGRAHLKQNLWILDSRLPENPDQGTEEKDAGRAYLASTTSGTSLWHLRFGHLGMQNLKRLQEKKMVNGMTMSGEEPDKLICKGCEEGKQHRLPFTRSTSEKPSKKLELVHSDVVGPINPQSIGGRRYILTFIDDFSRRSWIYLMKTRDELPDRFKEWQAMAEKQSGEKVKTLRTDNGGEYLSTEFEEHLKK